MNCYNKVLTEKKNFGIHGKRMVKYIKYNKGKIGNGEMNQIMLIMLKTVAIMMNLVTENDNGHEKKDERNTIQGLKAIKEVMYKNKRIESENKPISGMFEGLRLPFGGGSMEEGLVAVGSPAVMLSAVEKKAISYVMQGMLVLNWLNEKVTIIVP